MRSRLRRTSGFHIRSSIQNRPIFPHSTSRYSNRVLQGVFKRMDSQGCVTSRRKRATLVRIHCICSFWNWIKYVRLTRAKQREVYGASILPRSLECMILFRWLSRKFLSAEKSRKLSRENFTCYIVFFRLYITTRLDLLETKNEGKDIRIKSR